MDDRTAYMLNGLVEQHYDIGRVLRFRMIKRGRQAECLELLTAGQREFLLMLFPTSFDVAALQASGALTARLGASGFSVPKAIHTSRPETGWVADGPQGTHLMLSTQPQGQALPMEHWSNQNLSHLGLRLAWMHRLLNHEQPFAVVSTAQLTERLKALLAQPAPGCEVVQQALQAVPIEKFMEQLSYLSVDCTQLWHGSLTPDAVLLDADHQIVSIVDWGCCQVGFPHEDVVDVFLNWCVDAEGLIRSPEAQSFLQSYFSLHSIAGPGWHETVLVWTAHRLIASLSGCAPLPRGFLTILENPHFLSAAITICQSKL